MTSQPLRMIAAPSKARPSFLPSDSAPVTLHDNTSPIAASDAIIYLVWMHRAFRTTGAEATASRGIGHFLIEPADLSYNVIECLVDIDS